MNKLVFEVDDNAMHYIALSVMSQYYKYEDRSKSFDAYLAICLYECRRELFESQWFVAGMDRIAREVWRSFDVK